ncbi:hypothetical protein BJL95_19495 [Methylomonas sp. LWB]|uniref:OmpA family protein n=1 Tax=Methylomonas sp. LWB TaxID=1905845 RepID=UPI0008DB07C8|nr:OmpA family protein [Methylomonas sp. LWB]OHX36888.1 hypothetical protein BJL95_19495 [Methylomonas sp. LWB]
MKKQRSLDLDGLDGILRPAAEPRPPASRAWVVWSLLLLVIAAIGAAWVRNHPVPKLEWPETPNRSSNAVPAPPIPPSPPTKQAEAVAALPTTQDAEPTAPAESTPESVAASPVPAVEPQAKLELPTEPTAAGPVPANTDPVYIVYFKFNSTRPSKLSDAEKNRLLEQVKQCGQGIRIVGHTCNLGSDLSNRQLGQARAEALKIWLTGQGIAAPIETTTEGWNKPAASNDTPDGQKLNRRAEVRCLTP